jgi:mono/diheme cytochrome c family protein
LRILRPVVPILVLALAGCRQDMVNQPRYEPLEPSAFFPDGAASRPLPAHTVARGQLREDAASISQIPVPLSRALLERGRGRYEIYCSVCHGRTGDGRGMIVQRGFPPPPSFHLPRLREAPIGHFFEVITHGYGVMYPYAARVAPSDRWAISAYIRALQLSENATLNDLTPEWQAQLKAIPP